MEFENYIFDLYGTLIDIHTDENSPHLWAAVCDYIAKEFSPAKALRALISNPEALKDLYFKLDRQERKALSERLGTDHPEIRIEWVWERILSGSAPSQGKRSLKAA